MNLNNTLHECLALSGDTYDYLDMFFHVVSDDIIEEKIANLQNTIKLIQTISYKLAAVSNLATKALSNRKRQIRTRKLQTAKTIIDPYPCTDYVSTVIYFNPTEKKELVPSISIPVKFVDNLDEIPTSHIYYVKDIRQYAVNIEGLNICGNLGNITQYQSANTAVCEYGANCKNAPVCKYYHDTRGNSDCPPSIRNFTTGSWIYDRSNKISKYYTRKVGSANTLKYDIDKLKKTQYVQEVETRESQLMHDILVYLAITSEQLVARYKC